MAKSPSIKKKKKKKKEKEIVHVDREPATDSQEAKSKPKIEKEKEEKREAFRQSLTLQVPPESSQKPGQRKQSPPSFRRAVDSGCLSLALAACLTLLLLARAGRCLGQTRVVGQARQSLARRHPTLSNGATVRVSPSPSLGCPLLQTSPPSAVGFNQAHAILTFANNVGRRAFFFPLGSRYPPLNVDTPAQRLVMVCFAAAFV